MKSLILAKRRQGKTKELIEKCAADNYSLIVCPNITMCEHTFKMAQDMGKPIPKPITFNQFISRQWCLPHIDKFYFDELQMSLSIAAMGVPIDTAVIDTTYIDVKDWSN